MIKNVARVMRKDPLHIISSDDALPRIRSSATRSLQERVEAVRAQMERQWLRHPEIFNPDRTVLERTRILRSWRLIQSLLIKPDLQAADLGFGWGVLTRRLANAGVKVDAFDAAAQALEHFADQPLAKVQLIRGVIPHAPLADQNYDLVICTELIATLHPHDQRLLISELYRITKPNGHIVLSTALDINSDGALEQLAKLIDTELMAEQWVFSYHTYYLRCLRLWRTPERYVRLRNDAAFRDKELAKRKGFSARWLKMQGMHPLYGLWRCVSLLTKPIADYLEQSQWLMRWLETFCRTMKSEAGISHAICIAKRKPLQHTAETGEIAMSRPTQRLRERVWE